jgi:GNAT superfamily N-acetyltransferase
MRATGRSEARGVCVRDPEASVRSPGRDYLSVRVVGSRPPMHDTSSRLQLRTATMDDARIVADLEAARNPQDPRDPTMLRFWWATRAQDEAHMVKVAESDSSAVAFIEASHEPWAAMPKRFGSIRLLLHPKIWSEPGFGELIDVGESWLGEEGAAISVAHSRERLKDEIRILENRGYREARRSRVSELDLVAGREKLLAGAERTREQMEKQGVRLMTLDQDDDPERMTKLYELTVAAERDIPTTVPWRTMPYDEWHRFWFENPGVREDRFWIAREGAAMVGLSVIGYSPERGLPWTFFTATSQSVRGRGMARALKYQTLAQAIALGAERVRTNNDGQNAPILHLNSEMGYELVDPVIELHRELGS